MPNLNEAFPSKYIKASDLPEEGSQSFTIEKVAIEEVGLNKERKLVIAFEESDKSMICNKTNARTIAKVLGSENTDEWEGKTVNLYRAEVEFQGEMVESIRVKIKPVKTKPHRPVDINEASSDDEPADIAF